MTWSTPADLRGEVQKLWDNGRLLAGIVDEIAAGAGTTHQVSNPATTRDGRAGETGDASPALLRSQEFPLALRFRRPGPRDLATRFEEVRSWIRVLESGSRDSLGAGYSIVWDKTENRLLGRNATPKAAIVPTRADAFALIEATDAAARFEAPVKDTIRRFPELCDWLRRRPHVALSEADSWERILAVVEWFRAHPRCGRYVRQIDVQGVDTKFIEKRKSLISELLDIVLAVDHIDFAQSPSTQFEARYGLIGRPPLVRIRILDAELAISGLMDLTVRLDELAQLEISADRVFIVENEITGIAFPFCRSSALIFGGGYAIERLAALRWLQSKVVLYWGDIDTHGFAILDRLRAFLPEARSLLMDRCALLEYRNLWSTEEVPFVGQLSRLTPEETALYDDLRFDRLGRGVRLEQERIPLRKVAEFLGKAARSNIGVRP